MSDDSSVEVDPQADPATYDPEQAMRPQRHSFVRMRADDPYEADSVYSEPATIRRASTPFGELLANDQLNLTVNLLHLRRLLLRSDDGAADGAGTAAPRIQAILGELEDLRDAIDTLLECNDPRRQRLLAPGASLSAYVKGLYAYCEGIVDAFEDALTVPPTQAVEWSTLRFRLGEAAQFFFDGLVHAVRFELGRERGAAEALASVEELFFVAAYMHERLHRPFR